LHYRVLVHDDAWDVDRLVAAYDRWVGEARGER
jgi:hypothetical protein